MSLCLSSRNIHFQTHLVYHLVMILVAFLRMFPSFPMYVLTKRDQVIKLLPFGSSPACTLVAYGLEWGALSWAPCGPAQRYPGEEVHRGQEQQRLKSFQEPCLPSHVHLSACIQRKEIFSLLCVPRGAPFSHQQ